jgi:hypothetical protein
MAKQDKDPLASLTKEAREELEKLGADIDKAEKEMETFEELGVDTSRLRDKINWARKARDLMLKNFTSE